MTLTFESLKSEYAADWAKVLSPNGLRNEREIEEEAGSILWSRDRFVSVEEATGVPWFVTGIILTRESGSPPNFHTWLHNGDPMFDHSGHPRRTTHVPRGLPNDPACTWEEGCVDAYKHDGLYQFKGWCPEYLAYALEKYNGFGYRLYHRIKSPYLWGSTIVQERGKYDEDGQFNPSEMDQQIGGMALLAVLMKLSPNDIRWETPQ